MRRFVYLSIALLLLLSFSGCVVKPGNATTAINNAPNVTTVPNVTTIPQESEAENEAQINTQFLPAEVENPDKLPVLKWVCLTEMMLGGGLRVWNEAAAIELNQMLAERNMPFRVQFILMTSDQYYGEWEWMEQEGIPELLAEADLIYGYFSSEDMEKSCCRLQNTPKEVRSRLLKMLSHMRFTGAEGVLRVKCTALLPLQHPLR